MGALQSIFFRPERGYKKYNFDLDGNKIDVNPLLYQLDGVIKEQHSSRVQLTKHPVEYGVNISDHAIKQPMKVIVDGVVTNSPFAKQLLNRLPGDAVILKNVVDVLQGERARNAYAGLIELQNERKPVRLQTGLLSYENMMLVDVSAPNDIQDNLRVKLTFEEIFIADGVTTGAIQGVVSAPVAADIASVALSLGALIGGNLVLASGFKGI